MIKNNDPISMAEALEFVKDDERGVNVVGFIKKFTKLNAKEAQEIKEKLKDLDLMKLRLEHIVKIIDVMPENAEELNKIFTDVSLDEDETKKILETIKEFK